jgi:hypothetical protein
MFSPQSPFIWKWSDMMVLLIMQLEQARLSESFSPQVGMLRTQQRHRP